MNTSTPIPDVERALRALGEILAALGERVGIVVLGGAALNLLGVVERLTTDVDVLALGHPGRRSRLSRPDPLPPVLVSAVERVARDLGLSPDWLNAAVSSRPRLLQAVRGG